MELPFNLLSGERNERLPDLCFSICRFNEVVFILRAQPHAQSLFLFPIVFGINYRKRGSASYYRKRGSASYIVREVHSVRERERERERDTEREREREREKDGSDVTIVALKLAMSFALLLAKTVCTLVLATSFALFLAKKFAPQWPLFVNSAEFTLSVAKNVALFDSETVRILRTVKWRD